MKEKTYVEDVDRNMYDFRNDEKDAYRIKNGLTEDIVEKISEEKHDPEWMHDFRLNSLKIYHEMKVPDWGPSIEGLNMDNIATYVRANTKMKGNWSEVPEEIKDTFEKLGIPQAERTSLAGVGAQYDSELVYHNVRKEVEEQGVIYTDMESALTGKYADMVKSHFMKLVTPHDHKFAALHGAVWSGGSFVYVPKGVSVEIPLQSYFRLNAAGAGQFEHRRMFRSEVQCGKSPCRLCRAFHWKECEAPLLYDRELVEKYVQFKHKTGEGRGRRSHRVGIRFLRFPCFLPLPDERVERRGRKIRVHRNHIRR